MLAANFAWTGVLGLRDGAGSAGRAASLFCGVALVLIFAPIGHDRIGSGARGFAVLMGWALRARLLRVARPALQAMTGKGGHSGAGSRGCATRRPGRRIRQVTSHPSIHHHPFFFVPAYDRAMRRLVFVSHRTGAPQIFFEDSRQRRPRAGHRPRRSRRLVDLSRRTTAATSFSSPAPPAGGSTSTRFEEERLADFGAVEMRESGMVGAAMGTTALSATAAGGRYRSSTARSRASC